MAGYLSTRCKSTFGFYLHQWASLFFVDFLDSTFVTVTVLNSSMQKLFIEALKHMISFKIVILKCCTLFLLSFDLWTFQML